MLNGIIDFSLRHRFLVILGAVACAAVGGYAVRHLDIDAFPDTTPVQVQINTVAAALGPEEVEQQITFPIEQVMSGLPRVQELRSISKFGLSQVVVTFDDGMDIYFARQLINERLSTVQLPLGLERPRMGPVATGLGEVFHYVVTGKGHDVTELRTIHDWVIKPKMRTVRGTAEINTWGGYEKQFQVRIDPARLDGHQVTFEEVIDALEKNNRNVGGGYIRRGTETLLVHGVGRTVNIDEIKKIRVTTRKGKPVRVEDVAEVEIGHEVRRGAVTADGKGEVVLGLGFMLMGENSHQVTWALKNKLAEVKESLPANIKVEAVYDRTELVSHVIDTVRRNLFEGGLFVIAILFLFLGNIRAALIVAVAIPFSMLFAFSGMWRFGIAASLLSLGAIDFGMVVDSSVVMIENCVRHLAHENSSRRSHLEVVRDAAVEVRGPTMFGELIIMIVYLPILTLEGIEGKMFRPMALTVIFALAGSMLLSLTLMPVLASLVLPSRQKQRKPAWLRRGLWALGLLARLGLTAGVYAVTESAVLSAAALLFLVGLWLSRSDEDEPILMRLVKRIYAPILAAAMRHKAAVIVFAVCMLVAAFGLIAPNLGSEFVPTLSEGAIEIGVVRLAGTALEQSIEENTRIEQAILKAFPDEVQHVWSRIGMAEVATDPMGVELTDMFISCKPRGLWKKAGTQAELTELVEKEVRQFPGASFSYSQPIQERIEEMTSGVRAALAVKIFGDDLSVLKGKALEVAALLAKIPGSADVKAEQVSGQPVLQVKINQERLARYDLSAKAVLDMVESLGSKPVGEVVEGQYRFPLAVRLPEESRKSKETVEALLLSTASGERIPLGRVADVIVIQDSPSTITREWGQRRITVTCNVRGRDLGGFVSEAQRVIREKVELPKTGRYRIDWGGQFENLISAWNRLLIVGAVAVILIFGLLYATYHNVVDVLRVLTGVPFAWVGGVFALWLRDMPFSISAGIGFIALSGVAVLDDMILVSYIRQLREKGLPLEEAVGQAAQTRLRPVLMTTLVACLGFVPMAFSTGMGAEVQRPLATVVIGGVISAMVMSLLVLRVLYVVFKAPVAAKEEELAAPGVGSPTAAETVSV